ncbi:TPA: ribonuclease H [Candidatus Collierbacteria bacterium]|uniref:Ribonuclease HI n=1 Tax=Candidatus Collierbacteria bacterium GW2011_GWA2_42_17 TaxID=1618378 RepID=A0A0G1BAR4_9BACT|nr:MAG: ribonuclease HI [Candidatus Collierbacteria bacterium GW2011_GWB2_42_12]KKS43441.1 MAG: ribonuclease HI [Candidatus Collierbacteria bacterium GW2011_GWA2_42_17]KKS62459.1 MAG: ribonuclease HI [Candidatus Collierbacteria bacterium GW2011_GWE2_42_48]KKS62712.1 MAG: ribonuclease HI [Candidatus Collierbacteria bacterium GW2011_GWD2_42_50]KKS63233.1 MAG: ribonuclease HI [Candidatus Collierbacteria bacterium GW2011_GWF1_42_50]KKS64675.1 MAG: ribonuclease HI [Candidatus Collierbacteria bacter
MTEKYELLEINTDGGSRGNPGPAGIGVYAHSSGKKVFTISETIGENTNNVAEYTAVIRSLEVLLEKKIFSQKLKYILDSELIVRQITGKYKVKLPHLKALRQQVVDLVRSLREKGQIELMTFITVPREQNKEADKLVNEALDK